MVLIKDEKEYLQQLQKDIRYSLKSQSDVLDFRNLVVTAKLLEKEYKDLKKVYGDNPDYYYRLKSVKDGLNNIYDLLNKFDFKMEIGMSKTVYNKKSTKQDSNIIVDCDNSIVYSYEM